MKSSEREFRLELGNQTWVFRTGALATQANGSILCQVGDTVVLGNCTVSAKPREGIDFLPLQLVFQEKYYAGGKVAGSRFRKREGRPSDHFVLLARVVDRGLRPMFPKYMRRDIQVFCTALSYDFEHEYDIAGANAANLAVAISDCPCDGPIASVRVGMIGGELVLNPSREAMVKSDLDLFLTASLERVVMIEAGANQLPEADILRAIEFGKKWAQKLARFFADIQKEVGKEKFAVEPPYEHSEAYAFLEAWAKPIATKAVKQPMPKLERRAIFDQLMTQAPEKVQAAIAEGKWTMQSEEATAELLAHVSGFVDKIIKAEVRRLVLEEGIRMSGRGIEEIRSITAVVDPLPNRVHGSGLFQRGETQGLTTCTLGGPGDKMLIEGMEGEEERRYMHHYNFPPFSVGETKPFVRWQPRDRPWELGAASAGARAAAGRELPLHDPHGDGDPREQRILLHGCNVRFHTRTHGCGRPDYRSGLGDCARADVRCRQGHVRDPLRLAG